MRICTGVKGLEKVISEGKDSFFWEERWAGNTALKESFPRLYSVCHEKRVRVSEMGEWREGEWRWRRGLFERDQLMLNNLIDVINRFPLKQGVKDRWKWRWESNGEYSTKSAYEREYHLQFRDEGGVKEVFKILWNNITPLKIQIHAWISI